MQDDASGSDFKALKKVASGLNQSKVPGDVQPQAHPRERTPQGSIRKIWQGKVHDKRTTDPASIHANERVQQNLISLSYANPGAFFLVLRDRRVTTESVIRCNPHQWMARKPRKYHIPTPKSYQNLEQEEQRTPPSVHTFGFGCAFEYCDPRIGEIKRVIAADIREVGKLCDNGREGNQCRLSFHNLCYKQHWDEIKAYKKCICRHCAVCGLVLQLRKEVVGDCSICNANMHLECARKLDFYCIGCHHAVWPL